MTVVDQRETQSQVGNGHRKFRRARQWAGTLDLTDPHVLVTLLKYYTWAIVTKFVLGVIYVSVIREGLAYLIPALGQRVSKIPGLYFFADYESTFRLDLAFFMAIFMLVAVWRLWGKILAIWLYEDHSEWTSTSDHLRLRRTQFFSWLAITIILADAALFYLAICQSTWGGSSFSLSALLATTAYLAVLIFISVRTIELRYQVKEL